VNSKIGPMNQLVVNLARCVKLENVGMKWSKCNLFQCFGVVVGELDAFPQMCRRMGPFYCLHIKIEDSCHIVRTRLTVGRPCKPSCSLTVAYREFAKGHDWRLHRPVTLYSFRQKFCVEVLGQGG
jgi:hypothetical protein